MLFSLCIAAVAYLSLKNSTEEFSEYRGMARDTNLSGRVQANMLMVRMNVKDYIITNSELDKQQFEHYWQITQELMQQAQSEINDPKDARIIDEVDNSLKTYKANFDIVIAQIGERHKLVRKNMDVDGPKAEKALSKILESARVDNDMTAAYQAALATRNLLLIRIYAGKFLNTNDITASQRVQEEFSELRKHLSVLDSELQNPLRRELLAETTQLVGNYETAILMSKIREASTEQATAVDYINKGVAEVDKVIQETFDVSRKSTSEASHLAVIAQELETMLKSKFKLA